MTASIPPPRLLSDHVPHPGRRLPRPRVDYTCRRPEGAHDAAAARSASPLFIPAGDNTSEEAKPECSYFVLNSSSGQVEEEPCVEWDFDNSTFSSTVGTEVIFDSDRLVSGVGACDLAVTKFQLACGWEYLRSTYQSIYMFGVTIGAPFNGVLADRYGRKMTWPWVLSPTPPGHRLLLDPQPLGSPALALSHGRRRPHDTEDGIYTRHGGRGSQVAHAYRHCIVSAMGAWSHGVGRVRLPRPGMADASADRVFAVSGLLAYSVPLLFLSSIFSTLSSPPLLLFSSSSLLLHLHLWIILLGSWTSRLGGAVRGSTAAALETPRLRTITLSLYTNYLLVGAVYFGLSLSGGDLSSDPFLYMVLTGVVELPAYTLVIPLVARYGRRAPVVAFFFMGAVALLALPFVPTGSGESMTLALMGKMSIASAFQILDFYSSELFPTECSGRRRCSRDWPLALPETLHVPLPDTIAHLEEREIRTR
ncbi:putative organic cation transporter protein [Penaeus vannamei]|uniref:Putative organic cation transporter protein n=1 Tax=Penaeus vannamei TaxID=6689 RepID=A0A3R7PKK3_PENVA|nr:putative organic cation transporter protein [Penaeus vannamei]